MWRGGKRWGEVLPSRFESLGTIPPEWSNPVWVQSRGWCGRFAESHGFCQLLSREMVDSLGSLLRQLAALSGNLVQSRALSGVGSLLHQLAGPGGSVLEVGAGNGRLA